MKKEIKERAILSLSQKLKKYSRAIIKISIGDKLFSDSIKGCIHICGINNGFELINEMPNLGWNVVNFETYTYKSCNRNKYFIMKINIVRD
jgi:hypothetical protein